MEMCFCISVINQTSAVQLKGLIIFWGLMFDKDKSA